MHNKYGFQICSGHKIKILMEMIEKRVYENKRIYKKEIMSSFFNLMNMKTKLLENIRKSKTTELLLYLFDQQNDNLIYLCDLLISTLEDTMFHHPKKSRKTTNKLNKINGQIKLGNRIISDMMDLINNYDNKMTRYPRCPHYENKIHTQLFTELGDILICKKCVGTIDAWCEYTNDYYSFEKITRMRELRTPPF